MSTRHVVHTRTDMRRLYALYAVAPWNLSAFFDGFYKVAKHVKTDVTVSCSGNTVAITYRGTFQDKPRKDGGGAKAVSMALANNSLSRYTCEVTDGSITQILLLPHRVVTPGIIRIQMDSYFAYERETEQAYTFKIAECCKMAGGISVVLMELLRNIIEHNNIGSTAVFVERIHDDTGKSVFRYSRRGKAVTRTMLKG